MIVYLAPHVVAVNNATPTLLTGDTTTFTITNNYILSYHSTVFHIILLKLTTDTLLFTSLLTFTPISTIELILFLGSSHHVLQSEEIDHFC